MFLVFASLLFFITKIIFHFKISKILFFKYFKPKIYANFAENFIKFKKNRIIIR